MADPTIPDAAVHAYADAYEAAPPGATQSEPIRAGLAAACPHLGADLLRGQLVMMAGWVEGDAADEPVEVRSYARLVASRMRERAAVLTVEDVAAWVRLPQSRTAAPVGTPVPADTPPEPGKIHIQVSAGPGVSMLDAVRRYFAPPAPEPMYLIWSNQQRMWWRGEERGYTQIIDEAGRYDVHTARGIVDGSTVGGALVHARVDEVTGRAYRMLDEVVVLAPESEPDVVGATAVSEYADRLRQRRAASEQQVKPADPRQPRLNPVRPLLGEACDDCGMVCQSATLVTTEDEHDQGVIALKREPCGHVYRTRVLVDEPAAKALVDDPPALRCERCGVPVTLLDDGSLVDASWSLECGTAAGRRHSVAGTEQAVTG